MKHIQITLGVEDERAADKLMQHLSGTLLLHPHPWVPGYIFSPVKSIEVTKLYKLKVTP